jgi:hypothetical protein
MIAKHKGQISSMSLPLYREVYGRVERQRQIRATVPEPLQPRNFIAVPYSPTGFYNNLYQDLKAQNLSIISVEGR